MFEIFQLFRGFAQWLKNKKEVTIDNLKSLSINLLNPLIKTKQKLTLSFVKNIIGKSKVPRITHSSAWGMISTNMGHQLIHTNVYALRISMQLHNGMKNGGGCANIYMYSSVIFRFESLQYTNKTFRHH